MGIVDRDGFTGNGRALASVGVAREVDELGTGSAHLAGVLFAGWLAPPGAVVERDLCASEARGRGVRLARELAPGLAVLCHELRQSDDGIAGDTHPRRVVLPRVRFHQYHEAIALRKVAGREAWRVNREQKARSGVVGDGQVRIEGEWHRALHREFRYQRVAHLAAGSLEAWITLVDGLGLQGDIGLEVRTVRNVEVSAHERIPGADQPEQGAHLGRVRLGVIAVEIEIVRGGAPASLFGAVL